MKPSLLIVIPTYGHFVYAERAVRSALDNTTTFDPKIFVVDDATPDVKAWESFKQQILPSNPSIITWRYPTNGGLTRSWNLGVQMARQHADYCCVTNSDVVFAKGWDQEIFAGLLAGYPLVGPVTNAPGTVAMQHVGKYSELYSPQLHETNMDAVQEELIEKHAGVFVETELNGFCMVASTKTFVDNEYSRSLAFCPSNRFNSKGQLNPTPLMTLNESELQRRWKRRGLKFAACIASYVYHYRAVSRGDAFKRGDWSRLETERGQ